MIWEDRLVRYRLAPVAVLKTSVFPKQSERPASFFTLSASSLSLFRDAIVHRPCDLPMFVAAAVSGGVSRVDCENVAARGIWDALG